MPDGVELLRTVKRLELLDPAALDAGDRGLQRSRLCIERDARSAQGARQGPEAGIGRLCSLSQKDAQLPAGQREDGQVDGDRPAGFLQAVAGEIALHDTP